MNITLTEAQQEAVILTILKRDLQNQEDELDATHDDHYSTVAKLKKNIKMLKRAINFYSVTDEY